MYLGRVIGRVVATTQYKGMEGVKLQIVQPLDEDGAPQGGSLVCCSELATGPGDLVHYEDGREAAVALTETYVPVDATIVGFVEQAWANDQDVAAKAWTAPKAKGSR